MVGNIVPKQRREITVPPPRPAFKAAPVTRGAVESSKKKEGVGLSDLRDVDKAKVARLINHVMVAFKEIQRLKELLELERSTQAALVTKLQQQNQEVAAEVSQLRLKLASLQLFAPLPAQKVYLHAGRRPSLSPIKEAECSEAESEVTRSLAPESSAETKSLLRERDKHSSDFTITAGGKDKCISNNFEEGTEKPGENTQMGEREATYSQANVSECLGKASRDPEILPHSTGDTQMTNEEDATLLRKRPPPRPLPDLLSNILHRCKDFGGVCSSDQSNSSVKSAPQEDALGGSLPVLQDNLNPAVTQSHPQLSQASLSSFSRDLESLKPLSAVGTFGGQDLHDLCVGMCGDRLSRTHHVSCVQTALSSVATLQQCQAKTSVDLVGHEYTTRPEAGGIEVLCCKHLEAGQQCETCRVLQTHSKCTEVHQCLPCCQQHQSSNLTNIFCPETLEKPEKVRNEVGAHEDLTEAYTSANKKKLRFDPTAGEEGAFYYASDAKENLNARPDTESVQPTAPGETQGVQVGEKPEKVLCNTSSMGEERVDRETLESHWTPEAIERRNLFHRIPVISPRSLNDNERHADELNRTFAEDVTSENMANEIAWEVLADGEQEQLFTSASEISSIRNEKSCLSKSRRSSQWTAKCINCSSFVPRRPRKAPLSCNRLFAKYPISCTKCSSIVEPKLSTYRVGEDGTRGGSMKMSHKCSFKGKPNRQNLGSSVETHVWGTGEDSQSSDPSTPSSSANMARRIKRTTRLKPRLVRPFPRKLRGGPAEIRGYNPAHGEGSDPASVVYCAASEDMYRSTNSSTDYCLKARRHLPSFPLKVCRIHTRKINKKRGIGRVMTSVKLLSDQSSEPTREVYQMNGEVLDMLLQSDGKYRGQLKAPHADSAQCRIETWRFGESRNNLCKESTKKGLEQRSEASSASSARHGQLDTALGPRRGFTRSCEDRQRGRPYDQVQGRKQSSEKWKNFEVDNLLDRFIQSNAECAAELIKCSVYFESSSSRPSSRSTLVSEKAMEDYTASQLPFQHSSAAEKGTESRFVSPERVQPRREFFSVDHSGSAPGEPCLEDYIRCSKCGVFIKAGPVIPPGGAIEMFDTLDPRNLCHTCSAAVISEKIKPVRRSADHGPEVNREPANMAPPIVLPRVNPDDKVKICEAEDPQKLLVNPSSSEILVCNVMNSGDWASETLHDPLELSSDDHRMPIITGISVSSRRSTPPREREDADTAKELTEMFDMSLYDLVNDLERQRRDYWRRVHSHTMDERENYGKQDPIRRRIVEVEKVHRSSTTRRRLLPRKQGGCEAKRPAKEHNRIRRTSGNQ